MKLENYLVQTLYLVEVIDPAKRLTIDAGKGVKKEVTR
jgi:hypothetical protein